MKKTVRRVVAVLLVVLMTGFLLTGCGAKSKVVKTLNDYEKACKSLDVDGILDCLDPAISKTVRAVGNLFGFDISDIADLLPGLLYYGEDFGLYDAGETAMMQEYLESIQLKPRSFDFNSANDRCDVECTLTFVLDGEKQEESCDISLKEIDGHWYIVG